MDIGESISDIEDACESVNLMNDWHLEQERKIRRQIGEWAEWLGPWAVQRRRDYLKSLGIITHETGTLTNSEIERARLVPLSAVAEMRGKSARCPYHEDRNPSVWIPKGQASGFCFPCNRPVDAIGYIMETRRVGFVDAVRILNRA